jgi:hypothetical protein
VGDDLLETLLVDTERRRLSAHAHRAAGNPRSGVHPHRDVHDGVAAPRHGRGTLGLAQRLEMDLAHAVLDRQVELGVRLSRTGEQDPLRRAPRLQRALQLAGRRHLQAGAALDEEPHDRRVRVGLHRIVDLERVR